MSIAVDPVDEQVQEATNGTGGHARAGGTGAEGQGRLALAVVLGCALVIGVVAGVLLSVDYARTSDGETASGTGVDAAMSAELQGRKDVTLAVSSFVANLNNYSVKDIDGYRDRLHPLMTPGFAESFDLALDSIIKSVKATKMTSEGEVLKTAVSTIDDANATALVVADAHVTSAFGERMRHFRWKVTLVKRDGAWLIDEFRPVE